MTGNKAPAWLPDLGSSCFSVKLTKAGAFKIKFPKLFIPVKAMQCPICKFGFMIDALSNVSLDSGEAVLIFKNVPAKVCNNCGEEYFEGNITASILAQASSPLSQSSQFQVRRFDW
ncbi:type II toxin-antitoxin system MqsA family antitoxin [Methylomonas sp. HW2-6]|uniref:type II toxin-antitoxin system MqsA family antitoxin n=1 Tax=Methylomonas sp. HW2-6 TaxID=3376687 RepID=UPI004041A2A4